MSNSNNKNQGGDIQSQKLLINMGVMPKDKPNVFKKNPFAVFKKIRNHPQYTDLLTKLRSGAIDKKEFTKLAGQLLKTT
jgi:hypothetical protein